VFCASSIERLPTERAIEQHTRPFNTLDLHGPRAAADEIRSSLTCPGQSHSGHGEELLRLTATLNAHSSF
jgi:hypothetical protein